MISNLRFVIVSDSITACTGFGKQTRLLASELFKRGHEVFIVARPPVITISSYVKNNLKEGPVEHLAENFFDANYVEQMVLDLTPDVIILFRNARYIEKFENSILFSKAKTLVWYADENEDPNISSRFLALGFPDSCFLPISSSIAATLPPQKVIDILYHGLDFDSLPKSTDRSQLRKKWSKVLDTTLWDDEILLICADRNDVRKNWDSNYALFAEIKKKITNKRVRLLQITSHTEKEPYFDLELCGNFYGVSCDVVDVSTIYGALTDEEIYELLMLADLRISCSGSEGFGLLSLEAAALKVAQVTIKLRALAEYLGDDNPSLVDPYRLALYPKDTFYYSSKAYAIPDILRMGERAVKFLTNVEFRDSVVNQSYEIARLRCSWPDLANKLIGIIEKMPHASSVNTVD